jgi:hypothetical protein
MDFVLICEMIDSGDCEILSLQLSRDFRISRRKPSRMLTRAAYSRSFALIIICSHSVVN